MKFFLVVLIAVCQFAIAVIPMLRKKISDHRHRFPRNITGAGYLLIASLIITLFASIELYDLSEDEQDQQRLEQAEARSKELKIENERERRRNTEYLDVIRFNQRIIAYQKETIDSARQIIQLHRALNNANQRLLAVQNNTLDNITGGAGVPAFSTYTYSNGVSFAVYNYSKFPIRDIEFKVQITGLLKILNANKGKLRDVVQNRPLNTDIYLGNKPEKQEIDTRDSLLSAYQVTDTVLTSVALSPIFRIPSGSKLKAKTLFLSYKVNARWLNGYYELSFNASINKYGELKVQGDVDLWHYFPRSIDKNNVLYINDRKFEIEKLERSVARN